MRWDTIFTEMSKTKIYLILGLLPIFFCNCKKDSYKEDIYARYEGRHLVFLPDSNLINPQTYKNRRIKLIHTLDVTCSSCTYEILSNYSFIEQTDRLGGEFEIVGYSPYNDTAFNAILLQYPFYFDFYRRFWTRNKLKDENIVKTFLVAGKKIILAGDMKDDKFKKRVLKYLSEF